MNKIQNIRAFSLIELSVVILIIGILVIGITKGSRIIKSSKLSSATALTKNSPVPSIDNLVLWLEPTSSTSFKNQNDSLDISDGNTISSWIDVTPSKSNPISLDQTTAASRPTYVVDGINGLPTVRFIGDSNNQRLVKTDAMAGYNVDVTYFIVMKVSSFATRNQALGIVGASAGTVVGHELWAETDRSLASNFWTGSANQGTITSAANSLALNKIVMVTNSFSGKRALARTYQNKTLVNSVAVSFQGAYVTGSGDGVAVGDRFVGGIPFKGDISEFIIYDRFLNDTERNSVQDYLIRKYNIR